MELKLKLGSIKRGFRYAAKARYRLLDLTILFIEEPHRLRKFPLYTKGDITKQHVFHEYRAISSSWLV